MRYKLDPLSPSGISSINTTLVSAGGTTTTTSGGGVTAVVAGNNIDVDATDPANPIVAVETLTLADISDVTASATEVNYTDGVTSAIQTQLDAKPNVTLAGEDFLTLATQQITANPIDLDNLSATGTPSSSTFLRGDNTWATPAGSGDVSKVGTPVNNQVGVWTGDGTIEGDADLTFDTTTNTLATVNISPSGTVDGRDVATDGTKLDGIETGADVTDATNVNAAGATMNADTTLVGNGYFLDEDNMVSNDATKVPSQQSVKAYVDAQDVGTVDTVVAGNNIDVDSTDPANPVVSVETLTLADISDVTASVTEVNYTDGVTSAIQTQIDTKTTGAASSTDNAIVRFDSTTGKVIQNSGVTIADNDFMSTPASIDITAGALLSDTISEHTAAAGVTVDGVLIKDGAIAKSVVGLGSVDNTSDATKNAASVTLTNKTIAGGSNTISGITPGMWTNPYCFKAGASGTTTLTDNTFTKVLVASEIYDYNSNFASSTYTAPVAGVYHFDAAFQIGSTIATPVSMIASFYVNGSESTRGAVVLPGAGNFGTSISADILLAANDTVDFYALQNSAGDETTVASAVNTWFSGHLVHRTA